MPDILLGAWMVWVGVTILLPLVLLVWFYWHLAKKTDPEKRREASLGFFGALFFNLCLILVILALDQLDLDWDTTPGWLRPGMGFLRLGLPWAANLVPLVLFAIFRRQIALGAIGFFGFLVAWAILAGVLFFASCLVFLSLAMVLSAFRYRTEIPTLWVAIQRTSTTSCRLGLFVAQMVYTRCCAQVDQVIHLLGMSKMRFRG
jgi:hypothetical protein